MADWSECVTPEGHVYWYNRKTEESSWDAPAGLKATSGGDGLVWIPHPEEGFLPGKTMWLKLHPSKLEKVVSSTLEKNVDDLVQMEHINEAMIVHNLRKRFKNDQIYTNVGTILISVNPFKRLPLYTPTVMDQYMHKGVKEMPPHTFNIADNAFKAMIENKRNQSVLISGESGAGKTECTKQCLQYFAELAGSTNGVEQFILLANPILEAFGNAKTLRNNNSSRFGKWVEIHFDTNARICGASTVNYLLEKSRVVYQIKGERNFHIFYQLLAGLNKDKLAQWHLKDAASYNYLNTSGCITIEGVDDAQDFEEVKEAMARLSFKEEEINDVFQLTVAVLQLGNLMFKPEGSDPSRSEVADKAQAQVVAGLLGVSAPNLELALTSRLMEIRGCAPTRIPLTPEQARDACDALAKALYGRLFDWIVRRINQSMKPSSAQTTVIGVLDIFGFEIFDKNSFEQLCINFTNEKLQQHFNQYTFKLEEALYQNEQIKYEHITFIDNQPVLDLIEKKTPQGIMLTLDEQLWVPKGSDSTFILACNKTHGARQHASYAEVRTSQIEFVVKHYAGDVTYDATGFLDKNKDTLQKDLLVVVEASNNQFISVLFPAIPDADRRTSKVTLGSQFRRQLEDLMNALNATEPHFIRAIKPNMHKVPNSFQGALSLQQLRYAGVFEAVKIRQTGYPFRYPHQEFLQRYGILNKAVAKDNSKDLKTRCGAVIKSLKGDFSDVQVGKTRILYRANSHRSFELLRNIHIEKLCVLIQKHQRRHFAQKLLKRIKLVKKPLEEALKSRDVETLKAALEKAKDIEFKIKLIADCEKLLNFLVKEKEINRKLNEMIGGAKGEGKQMGLWEKIFDDLSAVMAEADEIELDNDIAKRGREIVTFVKSKKECMKMFEEASKDSNKEVLIAAIAKGNELGLDESEPLFVKAKAELARIEKEEILLKALEAAVGTGAARVINSNPKGWDHSSISTSDLEAAIREATAFGVRTPAGKQKLTEGTLLSSYSSNARWLTGFMLVGRRITAQVLVDLRKALLSQVWDDVKAVLMKAASMPFNNEEISLANEEVATKGASSEIIAKLVEATKARDLEAIAYGIQQAIALQLNDAPEVLDAERLLRQINVAKMALKSALETSNLDDLELAVILARPFAFLAADVARAEALGKAIYESNLEARVALFFMERQPMQAVYDKAHAIGLESALISEIRDALILDPTKFIQLQLKVANKLGDQGRAIRLQIQLKELFFSQFSKMFVLAEWKRLRDTDSFAKTKMFGREGLRRGMLSWTKDPIPISLTLLELPFSKQAVRLFKNVQGFMGDKTLSYANSLAQDLLNQGLATPEIRDEIYCQLIKQLTDNPNQLSREKGWHLMAMCLQTFPPSDDFVNYLELFLKERGNNNNYVGMLHDTQYTAQKAEAPNVEMILPTLHSMYNPWILRDVVTEIRPELVPADFIGWAGAGSPRRAAQAGIKDAVASFGAVRDIFYGDTSRNSVNANTASAARPTSESSHSPDPKMRTWRDDALDQIGKPKGQTIFALWKMEKGGSVPVGAGEEEMNVVDVGHPTIRRDSSPEQVNARKVRPIRGTLRNYNPIEASRPKNTPPNLRMQTLRGDRPSTPDPDSQATLRKFNEENVKRVLVMYDFDGGGDPKKLRIKRGEVITVLKEYSGWGMGELNGRQGLYPLNYVKLIE